MKSSSNQKKGRVGQAVYFKGRYGNVVREYVKPHDPRTADQLDKRRNLVAVCNRWGVLTAEQHAAWRTAAGKGDFVTETGERVRLSGYNLDALNSCNPPLNGNGRHWFEPVAGRGLHQRDLHHERGWQRAAAVDL